MVKYGIIFNEETGQNKAILNRAIPVNSPKSNAVFSSTIVYNSSSQPVSPAASTPGSVDFHTLPGFSCLADLPFFFGLQPGGLQRRGEAAVNFYMFYRL